MARRIRLFQRFTLPYLQREAFSSVMRAGLKYDRSGRVFYVDLETDLTRVNDVLRRRVGETLELPIMCLACGGEIDCSLCPFFGDCRRENPTCFCHDCWEGEDPFLLQTTAWRARMAKLALVSSEK
ncbi:MAG: hypothetical protein ACE5KH_00870 [Candidatus Geothermarchaeales archaeon]